LLSRVEWPEEELTPEESDEGDLSLFIRGFKRVYTFILPYSPVIPPSQPPKTAPKARLNPPKPA